MCGEGEKQRLSDQTNGFKKILQTKPNFYKTKNKKKNLAESAAEAKNQTP